MIIEGGTYMTTGLYKKGLVLGIIVLFIGASIVPSVSGDINDNENTEIKDYVDVVSLPSDDELDQYQLTSKGATGMLYSAQSFIPSLDVLTRVKVMLGRDGNPTKDVRISIRGDLNGPDLTNAHCPADLIQADEVGEWIEFDFPDINVIPGKTYFIVFYDPNCDEFDNYIWWAESPYGMSFGFWYFKGAVWFGDFNSWTKQPWYDYCFKTYGCNEQENQPPEQPTLTGPISGDENNVYFFRATSYDNDGDDIYYMFDWGDGSQSTWVGPVQQGILFTYAHLWENGGILPVKVKAKDVYGAESPWSDKHWISLNVLIEDPVTYGYCDHSWNWFWDAFPDSDRGASHSYDIDKNEAYLYIGKNYAFEGASPAYWAHILTSIGCQWKNPYQGADLSGFKNAKITYYGSYKGSLDSEKGPILGLISSSARYKINLYAFNIDVTYPIPYYRNVVSKYIDGGKSDSYQSSFVYSLNNVKINIEKNYGLQIESRIDTYSPVVVVIEPSPDPPFFGFGTQTLHAYGSFSSSTPSGYTKLNKIKIEWI